MGDPISAGLAIAQVGLGVWGAMDSSSRADKAKNSAEKKEARQFVATTTEITRQQNEVSRIAGEQKSDRIRQANIDLAGARMSGLERGVSGSTMSAFVRNIAYLEGADVARMERNRQSNIAAGEAAKVSARNGYFENVAIANNQASAASTSAWLGAAGSGLQIAGNYFNNQAQLAAAQNIRTG